MDALRHGLHRACAVLTGISESAAALLLAFIVVINALGVFYRYGLRDPIGWTEEAMRYAVVWATFLGASAALYRGEHMVMDLLDDLAGPRLRRALHVVVMLCIASFCLVVLTYGLRLAVRNAQQVSPTMNIPMLWPYLAVSVGAGLMLFFSLVLACFGTGRGATATDEVRVRPPDDTGRAP